MRLYASNELKSRLTHAAANGSVIAADILSELKKNRPAQEIIRGSYNFLSTKRKWTDCGSFRKIRIVFTAFNKDPEHPNFPDRNNPQAPWFPENRTDLEPSTFIEQFKNLPLRNKGCKSSICEIYTLFYTQECKIGCFCIF